MKKFDRACERRKLGLTVALDKVSVAEKEGQLLKVDFKFNRDFLENSTLINNLAAFTIVRHLVRRTS